MKLAKYSWIALLLGLMLVALTACGGDTATAVPAGAGPDIVAWVNDRIGDNALIGVIDPLDKYGVDKAYLQANFVGTAADAMVYNDQVWGVPESMEAITVLYNKKLIKEADLP